MIIGIELHYVGSICRIESRIAAKSKLVVGTILQDGDAVEAICVTLCPT